MGTACCMGTMCCQCLCQMCGSSRKVYSRIGYVIFTLCWIAISLLFLHYGSKVLFLFSYFVGCDSEGVSGEACLGISAVYRVSFSLSIFYFIMFVMCLFKSDLTSAINEGAWPFKFLVVFGIYFGSFFLSNSFFLTVNYISMIASFFFLIYEMVLLIDLAYTWNNNWVSNYDSSSEGSQTCWQILLIATTVLCFSGGLAVQIGLFLNFSGFFILLEITLTLAAGIGYTILSMSNLVIGGSILTCSIVFLFNSFMCVSVLLSISGTTSGGLFTIEMGIGFSFLLLLKFLFQRVVLLFFQNEGIRPRGFQTFFSLYSC